MVERTRERQKVRIRTIGMDAGYDAGPFLHTLEHEKGVVPHLPTRRGKITGTNEAADARRRARRRKRNKRYQLSQRIRKRVEEIFGWAKTIGGARRARHVGRWKIGQHALLIGTTYNLLRLARMTLRGASPAATA